MHRQDIEIPEPCHADWSSMRPEHKGRFCSECRTKVHDLSAMTQPEAQDFLRLLGAADVCVSYEHEDDGTLVFREPAPAPLVPISRLRRPRAVAAAVAGAGMAVALAACAPHGEAPVRSYANEAPVFEPERVIIPLGTEAPPQVGPPPVERVVEDEPCDPETTEAAEPDSPRVRGRMRVRTAGKPISRKVGTRRPVDDPFSPL